MQTKYYIDNLMFYVSKKSKFGRTLLNIFNTYEYMNII